MKIAYSSVQLQASHSYLEHHQRRESLRAWREDGVGNREQITLETNSERIHLNQEATRLVAVETPVLLPPQRPAMPAPMTPSSPSAGKATHATDAESVTSINDLRLTVMILMIERLTGRKVEIFDASELSNKVDNSKLQDLATRHDGNTREGWGLVYDYNESYRESESTQFTTQAIVRTQDGQEITLSLELNMQREFISQHNIHLRAGDALKDPLVINFTGNAAELGTNRIRFDLDADGALDEFTFLSSNSGLLALDHNGDGVINGGRELFGAISGDGFADLARYDSDRNQWLDENDAVFSRLLVWSKDADGNDIIEPLLRRNIGAIYLGSTATPFALKDQDNALQGQIRASGIYLTEAGSSGTVQQLDLMV